MDNKSKKETEKDDLILNVLGIILISMIILEAIVQIFRNTNYNLFWMCYPALIIGGMGILLRKPSLIKSQLYILLIPDLIWTIDFLTLILGKPLLGITSYFYTDPYAIKILTLQHLFIVPIFLYSLTRIKQKSKNSWKISIIEIVLAFIITRLLVPVWADINCVYNFCVHISISSQLIYTTLWFILTFAMIFFSRKLFIKTYNWFVIRKAAL